nr:NFACT RNA binding domain-containing protein [uncultured Holophaga sp.]
MRSWSVDAPLLFALVRARLRVGGQVQNVLASPRALILQWAPERRAGLEPGLAWIFLLNPAPELWLLHEKDEAFRLLKGETKVDLSRRWGQELKGARLEDLEGDPRERWLAVLFRRTAVTGRIEVTRLAYQAIPGRSGLRLDGLDLNPARMGMGSPFPQQAPEPALDSPPMRKWRERFGEQLGAALAGELPEVLEGEGSLFDRHRAWSKARAEKLFLAPKQAGVDRKLVAERQRLERYGEALAKDRGRHEAALALREKAKQVGAELYRLQHVQGVVELLDGTRVELPPGLRAEVAVQKWFNAVKRAERGLERVADLERERLRQIRELEAAGVPAPPLPVPKPSKKQESKKMERKDKRVDGKGKAFRSLMVEGFEVLIGKGDADNDNLTFKVGAPLDFWLHVAGVPGSHVVVRNPDRVSELPRPVLERAAELAAFFSKARDGGKVEVHWCRVADVSKPRGFPPGKVMLKTFKSVRIYPRE